MFAIFVLFLGVCLQVTIQKPITWKMAARSQALTTSRYVLNNFLFSLFYLKLIQYIYDLESVVFSSLSPNQQLLWMLTFYGTLCFFVFVFFWLGADLLFSYSGQWGSKEKFMSQLDPLLNLLELGSLAHKEVCVGEWAHFCSLRAYSYLMKQKVDRGQRTDSVLGNNASLL